MLSRRCTFGIGDAMADRPTSFDVAELVDLVGSSQASTLPARVLVVRCKPSERGRVEALFGELGLDADAVTFAESLADARGRLVRSDPGCIIVDLSSTEPSDLETVAVLNAAAPGVPILVMSTAGDATALQALAVGADEHVEKEQLDAKVLADSLARALERRRAVASRLDRDELADMLDSIYDPT
jgi:CheY-like chemotaxis protein